VGYSGLLARTVRVEFSGAVYYIMGRGNESIQWTPPETGDWGLEIGDGGSLILIVRMMEA